MNTVEQVLLDIRARRGSLTARIVWEESVPKDAPLHDRIFDGTEAEQAKQYQLIRCQYIIRSVRVHVSDVERDVRKFVHIAPPRAIDADTKDFFLGEYVPTEEVARDPRMRAIALHQMEREWRGLKRRYDAVQEFWDLIGDDFQQHSA